MIVRIDDEMLPYIIDSLTVITASRKRKNELEIDELKVSLVETYPRNVWRKAKAILRIQRTISMP